MPQNRTSGVRASPCSQELRSDCPVRLPRAAVLLSIVPRVLTSPHPHWGSLPCCRGLRLEESLEYLKFMENAEEEEAWISEKEAMVARGGSGDTLATTQVSSGNILMPGHWLQFPENQILEGQPGR